MIQEENTLKKAIEDTIKSNGKNNVKDDYTSILKFNNLLMGNDNFTPKFKMSQYYKTHYNEDKEFISNLRKDDKFKKFFATFKIFISATACCYTSDSHITQNAVNIFEFAPV